MYSINDCGKKFGVECSKTAVLLFVLQTLTMTNSHRMNKNSNKLYLYSTFSYKKCSFKSALQQQEKWTSPVCLVCYMAGRASV